MTLMMAAHSTHCACCFSLRKRIIGSMASVRRHHGPYLTIFKLTAYQKSPHLTVWTIVYFNTIIQDFLRSSLMKNTIECLRVSVEIRTWYVQNGMSCLTLSHLIIVPFYAVKDGIVIHNGPSDYDTNTFVSSDMYHCWMSCQQISGIEPLPPLIMVQYRAWRQKK